MIRALRSREKLEAAADALKLTPEQRTKIKGVIESFKGERTALRDQRRALLESADKVRAGVTLVNGILVARLLGEATAVRAATTRFLGDFRGKRLPRVWHI